MFSHRAKTPFPAEVLTVAFPLQIPMTAALTLGKCDNFEAGTWWL